MTTLARRSVVALVALLGLLTVLAFLDGLSPYLEIGTFFRLQYALFLGAAALAALVLKRFRVALVALTLVGINLLVVAPGSTVTAGGDSPRLRVLVLNVEHGNDDYPRVVELIKEEDPDVIGLTELTPLWARKLATPLRQLYDRRLAPRKGAYGIGLYSKRRLEATRVERLPPDGPVSVVATVSLGRKEMDFVLTHVHTPFAGAIHVRQLRALADERKHLRDRLAVCGDFNAVPWSQPMREFAATTGLHGVQAGYGLHGTWPTNYAVLRIPIDNCLISDDLALLGRRRGADVGSDHLPLIVELGLSRND
jgi:endonuclease/exonuclease/phosphatase (EEP) superfamily protein YafD